MNRHHITYDDWLSLQFSVFMHLSNYHQNDNLGIYFMHTKFPDPVQFFFFKTPNAVEPQNITQRQRAYICSSHNCGTSYLSLS